VEHSIIKVDIGPFQVCEFTLPQSREDHQLQQGSAIWTCGIEHLKISILREMPWFLRGDFDSANPGHCQQVFHLDTEPENTGDDLEFRV